MTEQINGYEHEIKMMSQELKLATEAHEASLAEKEKVVANN